MSDKHIADRSRCRWPLIEPLLTKGTKIRLINPASSRCTISPWFKAPAASRCRMPLTLDWIDLASPLGIPNVDCSRESGYEFRRPDNAGCEGDGIFRLQLWIACKDYVLLRLEPRRITDWDRRSS